ncbi:MAG TPA: hypothetical protein VF533_20375 [Solirubrobacteraceae bacterium]
MTRQALPRAAERFDPSAFSTFRFTGRSLDAAGRVSLRYALDDVIAFEERFELPVPPEGAPDAAEGLLALLHWVAGVSYFKTALPPAVACETGAPPPATGALLEALYSEGLGELAVVNSLPTLPRPAFAAGPPVATTAPRPSRRVLVPVGGGKDSAVALEVVRRSGAETALFSVGAAPPIERTVAAAGLPWLRATRRIDPQMPALNARGAINGHVPVTAIVSCVALLTAALHGFDAVALANERSASAGNTTLDGVEVNHQFSKGERAERLLSAAVAETGSGLRAFSILRPASELAIARAFARLRPYHAAFTSCNRVFRLDPALRASSWCGDCDKCRFVFLILAPFLGPEELRAIFGSDLLDDEAQFAGFALLTATGGDKPFECVGEVDESVAAIRLLATDPRWREHRVVRRLVAEVLPRFGPGDGDPERALALSERHAVPPELIGDVRALLGA